MHRARKGIGFAHTRKEREGQVPVSPILFVVVPLVVFLFALILRINHAEHFAPQAYYRRKRGGAPIAYGFESLAPRHRKQLPPESSAETPAGGDRDFE